MKAKLKLIFLLTGLLFFPISEGYSQTSRKTERRQSKKLKKQQRQHKKQREKQREADIKAHIKRQDKKTQKRMKKDMRKTQRLKKGRKPPFWKKWFSSLDAGFNNYVMLSSSMSFPDKQEVFFPENLKKHPF